MRLPKLVLEYSAVVENAGSPVHPPLGFWENGGFFVLFFCCAPFSQETGKLRSLKMRCVQATICSAAASQGHPVVLLKILVIMITGETVAQAQPIQCQMVSSRSGSAVCGARACW